MLQALVDRDPFLHVDREHPIDEVKRRVSDRVPVWRGIIEAAHFDLLREVVGIFAGIEFVGEWRKATKAYIENDAQRPNIHCTGIPSMP